MLPRTVQLIDLRPADLPVHRSDTCAHCGGSFGDQPVTEIAIRSARSATVTALLHAECAIRFTGGPDLNPRTHAAVAVG